VQAEELTGKATGDKSEELKGKPGRRSATSTNRAGCSAANVQDGGPSDRAGTGPRRPAASR